MSCLPFTVQNNWSALEQIRSGLWPCTSMGNQEIDCLAGAVFLSFDLNGCINRTDICVAMLRGFDMASYKKDLLRETRQVTAIPQFWGTWLHPLSYTFRTIEESFRKVLELDGNQQGGIFPVRSQADPGNSRRRLQAGNTG